MEYCSYIYKDEKMEKEVMELLKCKSLNIDQPVNWEKLFNGYSDLLIYTLNYVINRIRIEYPEGRQMSRLIKSIIDNIDSLKNCSDILKVYDDARKIIMNLMVFFSVEFESDGTIKDISFSWNSTVKKKIMYIADRYNLSTNNISHKKQTEEKVNKKHTFGKMVIGAGGVFLGGPIGGMSVLIVKNVHDKKKKEKELKDWIASEYFMYIMKVSYIEINKNLEVLGYGR